MLCFSFVHCFLSERENDGGGETGGAENEEEELFSRSTGHQGSFPKSSGETEIILIKGMKMMPVRIIQEQNLQMHSQQRQAVLLEEL